MLNKIRFPEHIEGIKEIKAVYDAEEIIGIKFEDAVQETKDNIHIETARISGIERREKILGITPLDTDSIEDRRFRILTQWYDNYPYTFPDLINRLNNILGKENYTLVVDYENLMMVCRLELKRRTMYDELVKLLESIVPLNIIFDISLRYNQHYRFKGYTHKQMKQNTHDQIRNELLKE